MMGLRLVGISKGETDEVTALLVSQAADRQEYHLDQSLLVLGRDPGCDIVLEGSGVSRRHAQFVLSNGEYALEDLGSKNGTWVNGARLVDSVALSDGDSIMVGDQNLLFRLPNANIETIVQRPSAAVAIVLFTDIENSTGIRLRLGDEQAQHIVRLHDKIVREALKASGGLEIKHTGDGIMASYATASFALDCAIAIQRGVAAHKEENPDSPLSIYVGLNAGEPIAEDDDLFGTSVDLAARLVDKAQPGQIIASDVVRQLATGKQFRFADLGDTELRGFEDPVRLWELRWRDED